MDDNKLIFNNEKILTDYNDICRKSSQNDFWNYIKLGMDNAPDSERSIAFKETIKCIYRYYLYK